LIPLLACGVLAARADWIVNSTPQDIPDNNSLGIEQSITLSGYSDLIQSVSVSLVITGRNSGAFNGDLFVTLQHDSGYAVLLNSVGQTSGNPFGYGDNGFDITLSPVGVDIHSYQTTSYTLGPSGELTGAWGVDGRAVDPLLVQDTDARTATLSSFTGLDANGTWTLFVADTSPNGEATLSEWGLNVTVVPEPSMLALLALGTACLMARRRCSGSRFRAGT
jgi:subtilisin-like proprotein convertase family protein